MTLDGLGRVSRLLARLYDIDDDLDVTRFVRCDDDARSAADPDGQRREVLLVRDGPDGAEVALYLQRDVIDRLAHGDFDAWCLVLEGISHLHYVAHRAAREVPVRQLELELQADVDKYATSLLAGFGVGLIRERSELLRRHLFDDVAFIDDAGSEQGERYRTAHREAARYTASLERRFLSDGRRDGTDGIREMVRELRRFYRAGLEEKLRRTRDD